MPQLNPFNYKNPQVVELYKKKPLGQTSNFIYFIVDNYL